MDVERLPLLRADREPRRCALSATARRRLRLALVVVAAVAVVATLLVVLPIQRLVTAASAWIEAHHAWGALLMPALFSVAIPLGLGSTMLEFLSGSVFGLVEGALLAAVGKACGSVVAFALGKRLGKDRLGGYLQAKFPAFAAMASVIEGPNWKPLLLIQLSSIPLVVKCYGLAITDVSVLRFGLTSLVGGFPSSVLWGYVGSQAKDVLAGDASTGGAGRWVLMAVGLVCTVLAMGLLFVYTRRELQAQLSQTTKAQWTDEDATESEESLQETPHTGEEDDAFEGEVVATAYGSV